MHDQRSLVALADSIEGAGADFAAMETEIAQLQAALLPGTAAAAAQTRLKSATAALERSQKRVNHANQQFRKELDAQMPSEAWAASIQPTGAAAHEALLGIICRYFERRGQASIAHEMLAEDALLPRIDLGPAFELQALLKCLEPNAEAGLAPIAAWIDANAEDLEDLASPLPSHIAELRFFQVLVSGSDADALGMLRELYTAHSLPSDAIERLAGAIPLYGTSAWSASQTYIDELRGRVVATLTNNFWQLRADASLRDHLLDTLEASAIAFPILDRASKALAMTPWSSENELPVEVPLPTHLRFHPVFVCPVLKEQTAATPPKLLPCGHMLSAGAFAKYSTSQAHVYIKCPYCPKPFGLQDVRDVRFIRSK